MKDRHSWGFISYHKIGLLHRWIIREANKSELMPLRWETSCGLWYSYEKSNDPIPNFTTEGIKCKRCLKEQERIDKISTLTKERKKHENN